MSAPASSTRVTSSPSRAMSADRMEGAMKAVWRLMFFAEIPLKMAQKWAKSAFAKRAHFKLSSPALQSAPLFQRPVMSLPLASVLIPLHLLFAAIWVGGMFFAVLALRPAAFALDPAVRLPLW